ncbi:MAG TPA: PSD1 and planctomycete cytochrome C domain-containing protein, partial [Planctomycetaceae bacterium]|nr:PSD1 and planctomycete cytochrome C domain-containing protein [Planctomycetaceae bacterium]
CHGPDSAARQADLRLDVRENALALLRPDDFEQSEVLARIRSTDPDLRMPPPDSHKKLSPQEIEKLQRWIEQGAEYEAHWALIPPERPTLPKVSNFDWPRNEIDRFVLARLERAGLAPSPEASKETLIRRVSLDLTGLPPTPEEVDEFLADCSPGAYETLVDRLLASPRYGETMAADWLDAARYADTDGYQNDRYRYMSPWRDWVIAAYNRNLPFDQFTIEQLAGDMLPDATLEQQIATGFGRNHRINSEGGSIPEEWAVEYVADRVETLGTIWLGLTLNCSRCHDHKFDAVTQNEFYQLYAYFNSVPEWGLGPNNGNSPPFINVPASWPNLSEEENRLIAPAPYEIVKTQTSVLRPKPGGPETVMVMQEMETPRPTYRLIRGMYDQPETSQVLPRAVPESVRIAGVDPPRDRLELARWLMHPQHPLTARVTVNRFWQKFFATGLVRSSENFGSQGELPSHPELLDWLATEFIRLKWDMKALQKLIVTSATYRQSSKITPHLREIDPENRLLARGPRHRLSAFALRDQALFAGGLLVEKIGGPSVKPYMPPRIWEAYSNNKYVQDHGESLYRRSLYTYWRRTIPPPTMMNFNSSDRETCTVRKDKTNTPLQALTLMNNITFVEAARFLAERMLTEADPSLDARLTRGFRLVTSRNPDPSELEILRAAYDQYRSRFAEDSASAGQLLSVGEKPRNDE